MKAIALLSKLQSADVVLPTTDGREIRLRRITEPTAKALIENLSQTAAQVIISPLMPSPALQGLSNDFPSTWFPRGLCRASAAKRAFARRSD
jgi:hypothetical protein